MIKNDTFILISTVLMLISFSHTVNSNENQENHWGLPIDITPKNKKDFEKNWTVHNGAWDINDGKLESTYDPEKSGGQGCVATFNKKVIGDFAIEFKAMIKSEEALMEGGDLSIIMSANAKMRKRYDLQVGGLQNKHAVIQMYDLPMAQSPYPLKAKKVYNVRAERINDHLHLYCNGKKLLTCKNQYLLSGRTNGLFAYGAGKQFWDIKLYEKKLKNYEIELNSVDRLLSKLLNTTERYFMYAENIRMLYGDILRAYNKNMPLKDRIYFRLASLELSLGRFNEAEIELSKIKSSKDDYDVLLLKAKAYFMAGKFEESKAYFLKCLKDFKNFRAGTGGSLKGLLLSKQAINLNPAYQDFFWSTYTKNSFGSTITCTALNLKNIDFLKFKKPAITSLVLDHNQFPSLKILGKFKELKLLSLAGNRQLTHLRDLNNISIRNIVIGDTHIKSLDGINRNFITKANVNNMALKDLSILKGCPNLFHLRATHNNLRNASDCANMKSLENLTLSDNKIKDISGLTKLSSLKSIDLSSNEIEDLSAINFENVISLNVMKNIISNIKPLENAKKLEVLKLNFNRVTSLESLYKIKTLNTLLCFKNPLKSFGSFAENPPRTFIFSIDYLSKEYINHLLKSWSKDKYRHHKRNLEILIELKKSTKANLKQFAVKKKGHYYLSLPIFLKLKDAHTFARIFGAHLISIANNNEIGTEITDRMYSEFYWIGLQNVDNKLQWSTGEKLKIDRIIERHDDRLNKDKFYALTEHQKWQPRNPNYKYPFIIEWDE